MSQLSTRMFRIVTVMMLTLAGSLVVNAATYTLKGSFDNWSSGAAMTYDSSDGTYVVDQAMTDGTTFKIVKSENGSETYLAPSADGNYWVMHNTYFNSIGDLKTETPDMLMKSSGNFRFRYNPSSNVLDVRYVPCTVAIETPSHGTVTVDKAPASAGETVTITATPASGYSVSKANVTVEVTAPAGTGQAPRRINVGDFVTVDGEDGTFGVAKQFTFTMPNNPLGVSIKVDFQERDVVYYLAGTFNATAWAGDAMTKDASTGKWSKTVEMAANAEFKVKDDVNIWYGGDANEGTKFVITGQMIANEDELTAAQPGENFTIARAGTYTVTFDPATLKFVVSGDWYFNVTKGTVTDGDITLGATTAKKGDVVTITVAPQAGYKLAELAVRYGENGAVTPTLKTGSTTEYEFTMPSDDVTVSATFTADPHMYLVGTFTNWDSGTPIELTQDENGNWVGTQTMEAGAEFKFRNELGDWYGGKGSGTFEVTGAQVVNGTPLAVEKGNNGINFKIPQAGTWTLTLNPTGLTLVISGTWNFAITNTVNGGEENKRGTALSATTATNGTTVTATVTVDEGYQYTIKATDADGELTLTPGENNTYTFAVRTSDVTVTTEFSKVPQLYVFGNWDEWANGIAMTKNDAGKWVLSKEMAADAQFKIVDQDGKWYGMESEGAYWITADKIDTELQLVLDNQNLLMPQAGTWTLTVDPETMKLIVSGTWLYGVSTNISDANGATVVLSTQAAAAGTEVTATLTVDEAYELGSVTIKNGEADVTYTVNEGVYTFTMPAGDVVVNVNVTKIPKVFLKGSFNEWALIEMEKNAAGQYVWTGEMPADVEFGFEDENGGWLGGNGSGKYYITKENLGQSANISSTGVNFYISVAGIWTITIAADKQSAVVSGEWDHAITVNAAEHGSVAVNDNLTAASYKQVVTLMVTPDADWSFGELTVKAGEETIAVSAGDNAGEYTFIMPNAAVIVSASFTQNKYNITLTQSDDYTIAVTGGKLTDIFSGTEITFSVTPSQSGYAVTEALVLKNGTEVVTVTPNGDGTYTFLMPMGDVTISAQLGVILQGVVFTAERQWATYYSALNLEVPEDVTAYVVTGLNAARNAVEVEEIDYIPAGVGILLYSDVAQDLVTSVLYEGTTTTIESELEGSTTGMAISSGYVLYNNTFLRTEAGTLGAYRSYLPATAVAAGAPVRLAIKRHAGTVTAIDAIEADADVAGVKYINLSGVVSDRPFDGVNIVVTTLRDGSTRTVKMIK